MLALLLGLSFPNTPDLFSAIKKTTLRDKRYMSIHLFARLFCADYVVPPPVCDSVRRRILMEFEHVEFGHNRYCVGKQFFNYAWILSTLLRKFKLMEHAEFIKALRCKHRRKFYTDMLEEIRAGYDDYASRLPGLHSQLCI